MIGEILTAADLQSIKTWAEKSISQRAYLAPTVFRSANAPTVTGWKYYKTLDAAVQQWKYLNNLSAQSVAAAGTIGFTGEAKAQTLGINVDFYFYLPVAGWVNVPYAALKSVYAKQLSLPFRFYKTDGSGPYFGVLDNRALGISATSLNNVSADKIAALDEFHRQVQLLKAKHNALANYLNTLSKKPLNKVQQQSFNEGTLLLTNLTNQIRTINGVEFSYSATGNIEGIGVIPVLLIVLAVIVAGATAWTITTITTEKQKTARINASFDITKWVADQKLKVAAAVKAQQITQADANAMYNTLDQAQQTASGVATASSEKEPGFLDKVENLALVALGIYAISVFKPQNN